MNQLGKLTHFFRRTASRASGDELRRVERTSLFSKSAVKTTNSEHATIEAGGVTEEDKGVPTSLTIHWPSLQNDYNLSNERETFVTKLQRSEGNLFTVVSHYLQSQFYGGLGLRSLFPKLGVNPTSELDQQGDCQQAKGNPEGDLWLGNDSSINVSLVEANQTP